MKLIVLYKGTKKRRFLKLSQTTAALRLNDSTFAGSDEPCSRILA